MGSGRLSVPPLLLPYTKLPALLPLLADGELEQTDSGWKGLKHAVRRGRIPEVLLARVYVLLQYANSIIHFLATLSKPSLFINIGQQS